MPDWDFKAPAARGRLGRSWAAGAGRSLPLALALSPGLDGKLEVRLEPSGELAVASTVARN